MPRKGLLALCFVLLSTAHAFTQPAIARIFGVVKSMDKKNLPGVSVGLVGTDLGVVTDGDGKYSLTVPSNQQLVLSFSFIGFETVTEKLILAEGEKKEVNKTLLPSVIPLPNITIMDPRERSNIIRIDPKAVEEIPNPTGNFETILKVIGSGVVSNNELSSEYSVRGGNFDENLVYVNDVEIYRPQLVRSGVQEGLSFINPDLVSGIKFSAGGFDAQYGDKMSSALDIRYKKPTAFAAKINYSLLGGGLSLEGITKNKKLSYLIGARQKSTKYLLGTLDTKGNYKPVFYDVQGLINYDLNEKTSLAFLSNFSKSKYNIVPQNRTTDFGTVSQAIRFTVYFDGQEVDDFITSTNAITLNHSPTKNLNLKLIGSVFNTREEETFDILGQYYLGELEKDPAAANFGEVKLNLGVGSFLNHARNYLEGTVYAAEHKGTFLYGHNEVLWGLRYQHEKFNDNINEWNYIDSAGYSLPHPQDSVGGSLPSQPQLLLQDVLNRKNNLSSNRISGYLQHNFFFSDNSRFVLTPGVRFTWWDLNKAFDVSPRLALSFKPKWKRNFNFRVATGIYYQPPFYKELHNVDGSLNTSLISQKSIHLVGGTDYYFKAWGRDFKFTSEAYYKLLQNLIPYKVDNVRIRYLGANNSKGYATGIDFRINGQFVTDAESWASFSLLKTQEDIKDDYYYIRLNARGDTIRGYTIDKVATDSIKIIPGYLPRLTDQRATFSIFFSDYLPKFPSYRMHLTLVFGTGFPVGPPGNNRYTDINRFPFYRRVDIGFSKQFIEEGKKIDSRFKVVNQIKSLALSVEVFNLLQVNNVVSYNWVSDVYGTKYGVPNYLTGRQLNVRLTAKF
jgi:hypothetical protein